MNCKKCGETLVLESDYVDVVEPFEGKIYLSITCDNCLTSHYTFIGAEDFEITE